MHLHHPNSSIETLAHDVLRGAQPGDAVPSESAQDVAELMLHSLELNDALNIAEAIMRGAGSDVAMRVALLALVMAHPHFQVLPTPTPEGCAQHEHRLARVRIMIGSLGRRPGRIPGQPGRQPGRGKRTGTRPGRVPPSPDSGVP